MPLTSWALWLALSGAAAAASVALYRRRETHGRGRLLLAMLRAASVALLLLILFDPELPGAAGGPAGGTQVLLDASLSMNLPDGESTRWARAAGLARERAGGRTILLFGDGVRPATSALPDSAPGDVHSRLLPALQAAAEASARRVVVITDGGIEDAAEVARWAPRLGLDIETESVGGDVANRSLVEASAPRWIQAGAAAAFEFGVAATGSGAAGDSVTVIARQDGRVVGRATVAAPEPGRVAGGTLQLRLDAPDGGGSARVELALEGSDAVADDDVRIVHVVIGDEPAGIALVSFRPDWEPRFLAPVLEQALGLPLHAYLRGATGQYLRLAGGLDAGVRADEAEIRAAVDRAELVVLHGFGTDAPAWAFEAARTARRLLVFPADGAEGVLPVEIGAELEADFWVAPAVPPSPVAPLLAGIELDGLTPLAGLRAVDVDAAGAGAANWVPLHVTRGRQGAPLPAAVAIQQGGRRWVVALGSGYWQWSFRGGAGRQAYTRLWSALGGWLADEPGTLAGAAVRPARSVLPRGVAVPWLVTGSVADSIAVSVSDAAGAVVLDTTVERSAADTAFTNALAPGSYSYRARAFADDDVTAADGEFTIERYSPEFARPRVAVADITDDARAVRGEAASRRGAGTPIHATPFPYIILILTLAAEWILRRRWGLR